MTRFHSKVVRVTEMGGKYVVNFKHKFVDNAALDKPVIDTDDVKMFDDEVSAEEAIDKFLSE